MINKNIIKYRKANIMKIFLRSVTIFVLVILVTSSNVFASNHNWYKQGTLDAGLGNSVFEEEFDALVNTIRYLKNEKNLSFEEIEKKLRQNRSIPYLDSYVGNHLNEKEKELYKNNRVKALLCLANGKFAIDYSKDMYTDLYNGNGDAFRHALWNYGMSIDVGRDFAKKWSDAHEYGASNNPWIEKTMDLYNNSIGLALADENPNTIFHSTFKSKTRDAVRNGRCRRIVNGKLVETNADNEK